MITWQEMDSAAHDGRLDKFLLPQLLECRQVLDGLVNAQGGLPFDKLRAHLYARVSELIKRREDEQATSVAAEVGRQRYEQSLLLQRDAVSAGKEAVEVSKEANKISLEANIISKQANTLSRWAVFVSCFALVCSAVQCVFTWRDKSMQSSHKSALATTQPTQATTTPAVPAVQTTNATPATSTNSTATNTPTTNSP